MEKCGKVTNVLRACSGCAGEYEDPERSAWEEAEEEQDEEELPGGARGSGPAEELAEEE